MSLRVCVLAEATPFTWVSHYVEAFRGFCDVITVGPGVPPGKMREWGLEHLSDCLRPNDIEVPFEELGDLEARLPAGWAPDLIVGIASNGRPLPRRIAHMPCPTAFISVDTWQCPVDFEDAPAFDFVFGAQQVFQQHFLETGVRRAAWLPLAFNPRIHHPVAVEEGHDVGFVGGLSATIHGGRRVILEHLSERFDVAVGQRLFGEEVSRFLCQSKVAFNHCAVDEVNMRCFECLGMGRAMVVNRDAGRNGLFDLFEDGKHLVAYDSTSDCAAKVGELLGDDQRRNAIAAAGFAEVSDLHSYAHRAQTIVDTIAATLGNIPDFTRNARALADTPARFIPAGARSVADVGGAAGLTKYALRRLGVEHFVGLRWAGCLNRARAFDETADWPGAACMQVDVAFVLDARVLAESVDARLDQLYGMLEPGGTAVLVVPANVLDANRDGAEEACARLLKRHQFTPVFGRMGDTCLVVARKRMRGLRDVLGDVLDQVAGPLSFDRASIAAMPPEA